MTSVLQAEHEGATEAAPSAQSLDRPCDRIVPVGHTRRYIYCIIDVIDSGETDDSDGLKRFGRIGIGEDSPEVFAITHQGIGAVVSATEAEKFTISRENTLIHQRVMEEVVNRGHTVLPVKFDTIAEPSKKNQDTAEQRLLDQVLRWRYDEFAELLGVMSTRVELGLKALWTDMPAVLGEIVKSNEEIRRLRNKIYGKAGGANKSPAVFGPRAKLGEMVKNALEAKKQKEVNELLAQIKGTLVDYRLNKIFGDPMFANLALLVEKSCVPELDERLNRFDDEHNGRTKLKYVGPVPPSNFIELVIAWED